MPNLESLSLVCQMDSIDLTDILVSLLLLSSSSSSSSSSSARQCLTHVKVVGTVKVQHPHIAHVLATHNVTLTSFAHDRFNSGRSWMPPDVQAQIHYYCQLNRYGRAKVQDTIHCSVAEFVQLLVEVVSASVLQQHSQEEEEDDEESSLAWVDTTTTTANTVTLRHPRMDSLQSFNVSFGLLSLAPSLWSEGGGTV